MNYNEMWYPYDANYLMSLKKVRLVKDGSNYALDITWTIETPERIEELRIPRAWLPIKQRGVRVFTDSDYIYGGEMMFADVGLGDQRIGLNGGPAIIITTIEEKTKEMTLEEIEKKLGHKVKIISKEETK